MRIITLFQLYFFGTSYFLLPMSRPTHPHVPSIVGYVPPRHRDSDGLLPFSFPFPFPFGVLLPYPGHAELSHLYKDLDFILFYILSLSYFNI